MAGMKRMLEGQAIFLGKPKPAQPSELNNSKLRLQMCKMNACEDTLRLNKWRSIIKGEKLPTQGRLEL